MPVSFLLYSVCVAGVRSFLYNVRKREETVTAQNLVALIHYHQLGAGRQGNDIPSPARSQLMIVALPADATNMHAWGGFTAHGKTVAILNQPLEQDVVLGVDYA